MRTATSREIRNAFPSVLRWVQAGETVLITKHGKVVATLTPPPAATPSKRPWIDLEKRLRGLFPEPIQGPTAAELIAEGRDR